MPMTLMSSADRKQERAQKSHLNWMTLWSSRSTKGEEWRLQFARTYKTVSTVDLGQWCNDSRELQGIRLEEPDPRPKSLVLVNTYIYIHPGTPSTKASWDFLEQIKDELGDSTVMCGDFNPRPSMQDQQGNKAQEKGLEEAMGDVIFNPVTTPLPTYLGP